MDKQSIKIDYKKPVKIDFNDQEIIVVPYINMTTKIVLTENYIKMIFDAGSVSSNLIGAEYALMLGILDSNTNIKIIEQNIDIDAIVGSGLWDLVKSKIENYQELRSEIGISCRQIKESVALERSIGNSFDKISRSIIEFLDKISSIDLSEENMKKLVGGMATQIQEYKDIFEEKSPIETKKTRKKKTLLTE
jgi:hypothetical protein